MKLEALAPRHASERAAWLTHPAVTAGVPIEGTITRASTLEWMNRVLSDPTREDFVVEDEQRPLAMCGLSGIYPQSRVAELYLFVHPDLQGRGIGTASVRLLCNHGFDGLGLERIFLWTLGPNAGARRLYEACGFRPEGRLREHKLWRGELVDRHVQGILRREWTDLPWASPQVNRTVGHD